jgi:hypothetical protein
MGALLSDLLDLLSFIFEVNAPYPKNAFLTKSQSLFLKFQKFQSIIKTKIKSF